MGFGTAAVRHLSHWHKFLLLALGINLNKLTIWRCHSCYHMSLFSKLVCFSPIICQFSTLINVMSNHLFWYKCHFSFPSMFCSHFWNQWLILKFVCPYVKIIKAFILRNSHPSLNISTYLNSFWNCSFLGRYFLFFGFYNLVRFCTVM